MIRIIILTVLILALAGCATGRPTPAFSPIRPDAPPPASPAATPQPTSIIPPQVELSTYTHPSDRFTIQYPENWEYYEQPDGVLFVEPGDQAGYSIAFNAVSQPYTPQELNQYLVAFVAENFLAEGADFTALSQEQQADDTIVARFATTDPTLGRSINEVRVLQRETIIFVLLLNAAEDQWQISKDQLQTLLDTFTPLDTGPAAASTETAPVWNLIGPISNEFGFLYPSNWQVTRQDETIVVVTAPDQDYTFQAEVAQQSTTEEAIQAHLDTLAGQYDTVESLPLADFPIDTTTGLTTDFLATTEDGQQIAGSIIAAAQKEQIYRVIFTAPATEYDLALEWFNPMQKSFKMLSPEELIQEEK